MEMFWKVKQLSITVHNGTCLIQSDLEHKAHQKLAFFPSFAPFSVKSSVADPDPGSGAFLALGSEICFFWIPEPGFRIPDP
jgi:hypothetical protein